MNLNQTISAERIHIAFFGKRNAGKSSLVNAVTGQSISIVSDVAGTTTDPVKKAMELLPLGPVVLIDTPGFDDHGVLGDMRVQKTKEILTKTDIAVLVTQSYIPDESEKEFISLVSGKELPYIIVHSKSDLLAYIPEAKENEIYVSSVNNAGIEKFKRMLGEFAKSIKSEKKIVADFLEKGDVVVLVTPIDESAPKGRLILPQQQTLREILDAGCIAVVCQDTELEQTLNSLKAAPRLVITDSQAFGEVSKIVPQGIPLTSFSILFARYKGGLTSQVRGAIMLSKLKDGEKLLISEGCTHHRQCGDIGTVKMPRWIEDFSGVSPEYTFTSGGDFPDELEQYKLIIHCGACMLNESEMKHRMATAKAAGVPVVNYGVAISYMNGILRRSLEIFPDIFSLLD